MEIINDVNGLFEFQDLGARTELKNKANLEQTQNLFDWNQIITKKNNIFDVKKVRNEGYHITGTTTNMYSTVLNIQKLQLEDGVYYLKDSAINNTDVKIYCQITLIDTDGHESYYNNTKMLKHLIILPYSDILKKIYSSFCYHSFCFVDFFE